MEPPGSPRGITTSAQVCEVLPSRRSLAHRQPSTRLTSASARERAAAASAAAASRAASSRNGRDHFGAKTGIFDESCFGVLLPLKAERRKLLDFHRKLCFAGCDRASRSTYLSRKQASTRFRPEAEEEKIGHRWLVSSSTGRSTIAARPLARIAFRVSLRRRLPCRTNRHLGPWLWAQCRAGGLSEAPLGRWRHRADPGLAGGSTPLYDGLRSAERLRGQCCLIRAVRPSANEGSFTFGASRRTSRMNMASVSAMWEACAICSLASSYGSQDPRRAEITGVRRSGTDHPGYRRRDAPASALPMPLRRPWPWRVPRTTSPSVGLPEPMAAPSSTKPRRRAGGSARCCRHLRVSDRTRHDKSASGRSGHCFRSRRQGWKNRPPHMVDLPSYVEVLLDSDPPPPETERAHWRCSNRAGVSLGCVTDRIEGVSLRLDPGYSRSRTWHGMRQDRAISYASLSCSDTSATGTGTTAPLSVATRSGIAPGPAGRHVSQQATPGLLPATSLS